MHTDDRPSAVKTFRKPIGFALGVAALAFFGLRGIGSAEGPAMTPDRIRFVVVESFDARHEADTPGHIGRVGGLGPKAPDIALGDTVYHEATPVGNVTHVLWDRSKESIEIEFDPLPKMRVPIGIEVWIKLGER